MKMLPLPTTKQGCPINKSETKKVSGTRLLECVPPGSNKWASLKADGNLGVCGDYKVGVKYSIIIVNRN